MNQNITPQHLEVIIVGAGLSGIGAAHYIQTRCPQRSYAVLEMRESMGGTWDLFRYPGIRSDSDMYTLGYAFRPWKAAKAIADGGDILNYIKETAQEEGIDQHIIYQQKVVAAEWDSRQAQWQLTVEDLAANQTKYYTCNFLFMCSGYYSYEEGYTPEFTGSEDFKGTIMHPQHWQEDYDYSNQKIVVIGSGATAVTLVPELAKKAQKVTMLQRSPTYIVSQPSKDWLANIIKSALPSKLAYGMNRWRNVLLSLFFYKLSRRMPNFVRALIKRGVRKELGNDYDLDTHFNPPYKPWDQRLCLVPDSDLFKAIRNGSADILTDQIERFTEKGIKLQSGKELEADLIVTATGLKIQIMSGMPIRVDGKQVRFPEHYVYRGMMFSDIPNLALSIGYTNASWTLKTDLTCAYVCRLLNYMDKHQLRTCTPRLRADELSDEPLLDFNSGYVLRALEELPKQGDKTPWKLHQNYILDIINFKYSKLKNNSLEFK